MSENRTIVVEAHAKVNLYLEVLGDREDGYHEIRSVIAPVSLCDELRIEATDDKSIETVTVLSPSLLDIEEDWDESSESNLVTKAASLLQDKTGCQRGARIGLEKKIPIGGGLGGGSADAAATLRALNELWELGLSIEALMDISAELGSDIPAMVHGGIVVAEGRGERVRALDTSDLQEIWMVLVNPMFAVSTKDIYTRCSSGLTSESIPFSSMCSCLKEGDIEKLSKSMFNGLQKTVLTKYPLIEIVVENINKAGAVGVLVSGSGASVLGLARDEIHARDIAESVKSSSLSPIWTEVVRTLI